MMCCSGKILVCLSETKWPSCSHVFLMMVLEKARHLLPNVPGIKEKQILLIRGKMFLDCFQLGLEKA